MGINKVNKNGAMSPYMFTESRQRGLGYIRLVNNLRPYRQ
jgi:hypothetical protein